MELISIEMPLVKMCDVSTCGFNSSGNCRAKAITIGNSTNPDCDTYFDSIGHSSETKRIAGVGACKVSGCKFNDDYECTADSISVGYNSKLVKCLTYMPRN
jgi:hypothetical protein